MTNEEEAEICAYVAGDVSVEEAREALQRFIDSHFNNPGEHARASIPADPQRDDDIRLGAFITRAERAFAALAEAREETARARAQLAALHAAATAVCDPFAPVVPSEEACRKVLDDLATAAAEHDATVRAPVEAERDQLAEALAEVRDAASESIRESFWAGNDGPARAARERVIAVLASLPADLAAQREARVRAVERARVLREVIAYLEAESADDTRDYCTHLRALADEAEGRTR